MRDRIERLVILPYFSIGCVSQASVAVMSHNHSKKSSKPESKQSRERGESLYGVHTKNSPSLHKLMKNFKSLSQLFVYKEELEDDDEMKMEMEIGLPTDVKHVAQIGWDGSGSTATATIIKGCSWDHDNINPTEVLFSLPSLTSLRQFS